MKIIINNDGQNDGKISYIFRHEYKFWLKDHILLPRQIMLNSAGCIQ